MKTLNQKLFRLKFELFNVSMEKVAFFGCLCSIFLNSIVAQPAVGEIYKNRTDTMDYPEEKGVISFPRMSVKSRDSITSPHNGFIIFNTTSGCLEINTGTTENRNWKLIQCFEGEIEALYCADAIQTGVLTPDKAASGVILNIPYSGGNGFSYDGQIVSSTGVKGLTATLTAGNLNFGAGSLTYYINGSTNTSGIANFTIRIGGKVCELNLNVNSCGAFVARGEWKSFSCYNLGAYNTRKNPFSPGWEINGGYWQWGRAIEAAPGPVGPNPEDANSGSISGWNKTAAPNDAWVDTFPMGNDVDNVSQNNPCPPGFRIPTKAQWEGVLDKSLNPQSNEGTWTNAGPTGYNSGKYFGSNLFLPASGDRGNVTGALYNRGNGGAYWSSTGAETGNAWHLVFNSKNSGIGSYYRTFGLSVRCISE
jgi:uncharacterized protein (TIGR02145 family)